MDTQNINIIIEDDDYDTAIELTNRLKNQLLSIDDLQIDQPQKPIEPGQAGGLMDTVLNLVLGKEVISKILDILKEIIVGKPKKTSISITCLNGAKLEITEENIKTGVITPETIMNFCNQLPQNQPSLPNGAI